MIRSIVFAAALISGSAFAASAQDHHADPMVQTPGLPAEAAPATAVVDAVHAALGAGDTDAALGMLSPDVVILEEGGAERSRDEYAGHHLPADATVAAATSDEVTRRTGAVVGDVAWIISEGRTTGTYNGRDIDRLTTETMVLVLHGDDWVIHHIHWSSRAPA